MPPFDSYLQQRRFERRWRVVTALVVAGALAAAAVWTLDRYASGAEVSAAGAGPGATRDTLRAGRR